jgi:4a-hydroxytetrahydrobiopterin dehydratase
MHKDTLTSEEITQKQKALENWALDSQNGSICKEWKFDSFKTAMGFFAKVGEISEQHNHHPEFLSTYTNMRLRLTTHDCGGLTQKDFDLAAEIDLLVKNQFSTHIKPHKNY